MKNIVISLDFDDTLVRSGKFPKFDPTPLPGCLETLEWLKGKGVKFILLTQRDYNHVYNYIQDKAVLMKGKNVAPMSVLQDAINWCTSHGIELIGVNENPYQGSWSLSRKVYSDIIIDDRCLGIPLTEDGVVDWIGVRKILEERFND